MKMKRPIFYPFKNITSVTGGINKYDYDLHVENMMAPTTVLERTF